MKSFFLVVALFISTHALADAPVPARTSHFDLKKQVEEYKLRYSLRDPYTKLVNYDGNGYEDLYGVRNFRVVLNGVYYRGGANNTHNRYTIRGNANPLQINGLKNLCEEGFTESVYLYATNYHSEPREVTCKTKSGAENKLVYRQINALLGNHEHDQLQLIYNHIKGTTQGPIYDHCWNGWHASGYIAAMSLMQFCGYTHAEADKYWVKNTDGNFSSESGIRRMLSKFKPFADLRITDSERRLICPN